MHCFFRHKLGVRTAGGHVFSVRYTTKAFRLCDSADHQASHCTKGKRTAQDNAKSSPNTNEQARVPQPALRSYSDATNVSQAPAQEESEMKCHKKDRPAIAAEITVETSAVETQAGTPAAGENHKKTYKTLLFYFSGPTRRSGQSIIQIVDVRLISVLQ